MEAALKEPVILNRRQVKERERRKRLNWLGEEISEKGDWLKIMRVFEGLLRSAFADDESPDYIPGELLREVAMSDSLAAIKGDSTLNTGRSKD